LGQREEMCRRDFFFVGGGERWSATERKREKKKEGRGSHGRKRREGKKRKKGKKRKEVRDFFLLWS
jgi:hypothetical protein